MVKNARKKNSTRLEDDVTGRNSLVVIGRRTSSQQQDLPKALALEAAMRTRAQENFILGYMCVCVCTVI